MPHNPNMQRVIQAKHIKHQSLTVAKALLAKGISPGDRICISAKNSPQLLSVVLGALRVGIAPAVISSSATEREVSEMSQDIGAKWVLNQNEIDALISDPSSAFSEGDGISDIPLCRPIHFTSGTTGRPKAVWSGWLSHEYAQAWIDEELVAWGFSSGDVHLVCGPLSHSAPLRFALMTILNGGSVVVPAKYSAEGTVEAMEMCGITTTFMAPTHLQRLMEHCGESEVKHSMRLLAHAGATCPKGVRQWTHRIFGQERVFEFYGSTEGQFTICRGSDWVAKPDTVGQARPGRRMRVDGDGMLWCQVPEHARFVYWGDQEKTDATWRAGGWFTVGDYGRIDAQDFVYLDGRKGDLIITGGVNVYPAEIERVLVELQGVHQVVAFGIPDADWGQRVCVAVTGNVDEEEIRTYLTSQLSGPKRPKSIFVLADMPLTHSGKMDRSGVQKLFT